MSGAAAEPDVDLDYEDDVQEPADIAMTDPQSPLPAARSHSNPAKGPLRWAQCASPPHDLGSRTRRIHRLTLPPVHCMGCTAARDLGDVIDQRGITAVDGQAGSRNLANADAHNAPAPAPVAQGSACMSAAAGRWRVGRDAVVWQGRYTAGCTGSRRLGRRTSPARRAAVGCSGGPAHT